MNRRAKLKLEPLEPFIGNEYLHYKTDFHYVVLAVARVEADPQKQLVVYYRKDNPDETWARPVEEWFDVVQKDGQDILRFRPWPQ